MPYKDKEKQKEFQRNSLRQRRELYMRDKYCVECGQRDGRLELDHIDPSLKINHRIWSWSHDRRELELAKCQVLCPPCHHRKTHAQNGTSSQHGTHGKYVMGCRCDECRLAHAAKAREYRLAASSSRTRTLGFQPRNPGS